MKEPTASKFAPARDEAGNLALPTSYDDDTTLFGNLVNRRYATVKESMTTDSLQLTVYEDLSDVKTPCILAFEGGEMWFVGKDQLAKNGSNEWVFSLTDNLDQRALHGSPIQPHTQGERVFFVVISSHIAQLRKAVLAAQRYHFILGTEESKNAYTPVAGEGYLCVDSAKIYFCFNNGVWTWANRVRHGDLLGLTDRGAHSQYAVDSDFTTWHSTLAGSHIHNGDDHDHTATGEGAAVLAIRSGVTDEQGDPICEGDLFFNTDIDALFISPDGLLWDTVAGVPSGAIAMFALNDLVNAPTGCPSGWSRYLPLDGHYPRGGTDLSLHNDAAGHVHTYTQIPAHYHVVAASTTTLETTGKHSHTVTISNGLNGGGSSALGGAYGSDWYGLDSVSGHTHSCSEVAKDSGKNVGPDVAQTSEMDNNPPFAEVIFCKKD